MHDPVRQLFRELADVSREERDRILTERRVPMSVRAEVESLLDFDSTQSGPLARRVTEVADLAMRTVEAPAYLYLGPYRLVRLLGSGGMGAVYLAERRDGEIEQMVAIKLLRADADRPAWRERFLKERQLLAYLNHPAIARLLDAGRTPDGLPYLVMEYVDGVTIDVFSETLDVRARLNLFLRVCEGVSHAHRHLIVHRDLKPTNILVDAAGNPKLLDFGIAKLLDDITDQTRTVERLLTPNYASPEQFRGEVQGTATDIYSLGAVLYSLLTGRSPREVQLDSGIASPADGTITLPSRLNPKLAPDLDYILLTALRKEPEERYPSVDAFADDIRAFLESRPVQARSGDTWYKTRKFVRRFRVPIAAATAAILMALAGFWAVNRERVIAQQRFEQVRQLANELFVIDAEVRQTPGTTKARQLIVDTALVYLGRLSKDVSREPELALDLGTAYMRAARVQGVPIGANLGQMDSAEKNLQIAEGLIRSVLDAEPGNPTAILRAAQIAHDRMVLAEYRRPDTGALPLAHESENWIDQRLAIGGLSDDDKDQIAMLGINVANWYARKDEIDDALRLLSRVIELAKSANQTSRIGAAQINVSRVLRNKGDLDGSLAAIRDGLRMLEQSPGSRTGRQTTYALALITQGEVLGEDRSINMGRPKEAAEFFERGFKISSETARKDPSDALSRLAMFNQGIKLADVVRHYDAARALAIYDEVLQRLGEVKNNSRARRHEATTLIRSTYALLRLGQRAEAKARLDAAVARLTELKLYPAKQIDLGSEQDEAMRALADLEAANGNAAGAVGIYQQLLKGVLVEDPKPETRLPEAVGLSHLYASLAALQRRAGRSEDARRTEMRRIELWRAWERQLPGNTFVRRQLELASHP